MAAGRFRNLHRNIAACMSSGGEKIWMHRDVACSSLNQSCEAFANVRMFNLEEGMFHQPKVASFADTQRRCPHIFVCFRTATAVTDNQNAILGLIFHAVTPDTRLSGSAQ